MLTYYHLWQVNPIEAAKAIGERSEKGLARLPSRCVYDILLGEDRFEARQRCPLGVPRLDSVSVVSVA
jgi:hypothetical protein